MCSVKEGANMRTVCYHLKFIDLGIVPAANPNGKRHIFTCRNSPNEKICISQDGQMLDELIYNSRY